MHGQISPIEHAVDIHNKSDVLTVWDNLFIFICHLCCTCTVTLCAQTELDSVNISTLASNTDK